MSNINNITTDLNEIKEWVEKRNGFPVLFEDAKPEDSLDFVFPDENKPKSFRKLNWNEFSERLENNLLALQFEEGDEGQHNYKFVSKSNN